MAGKAGRVGTLSVVAGSATLNVTPGHLSMFAPAAPNTYRCEETTCIRMGSRLEADLINVSTRSMAGRAKSFFLMARLAILFLLLGGKSVREAEIQVVDLRQDHPLPSVDRRQPG